MAPLISASLEDYLEVILELSGIKGVARVRDIAAYKGVSMPSVNGALKRLAERDLVRHGRYDYVELTTKGRRRANQLAGRHALLKRFLTDVLDVDEETANRDACSIEHHVSRKTVEGLLKFLS